MKPRCGCREKIESTQPQKRKLGARRITDLIRFNNQEKKMDNTHKGTCFCGAVEIEVSGDPLGMGYCHCESCRAWASALVHAWTGWAPESVKVTKGAEHIGAIKKSEMSERKFCKECGGNVMTFHPPLNMVDVCAGTIPTFQFSPELHVNYAETVHPMKDGLPKFKDFPTDFGGSGETLPE